MVQKYNEFHCHKEKGKKVKDAQTNRGTVMISAETAKVNNKWSGLFYELAKPELTAEKKAAAEKKQPGRPAKK